MNPITYIKKLLAKRRYEKQQREAHKAMVERRVAEAEAKRARRNRKRLRDEQRKHGAALAKVFEGYREVDFTRQEVHT